MRKLVLAICTATMLIVWSAVGGTTTSAQTGSGPVQNSQQLALPASAFPSDYKGDAGEAWPASQADGSSFSKMHVKSYTALGMRGAWYQYYAKYLFTSGGTGVTLVIPVETVYLGTYYADASSAADAYSDVHSNPANANPVTCSYGTRCVTYAISLSHNGETYSGLARIVQYGNAVAEIRTDLDDLASGQVSMDTFNANINGVSQAFVQTVRGLAPPNTPTNTPIAPTATSTSTPIPPTAIPTSTPTATPTSTPTSTPTPLFLTVTLGHKTVKVGKKQSISVTTLPDASATVVVTFPDGAKKRRSGTADQSGAYTWSFKQPSGHTISSRHTAKVVVTVSDGRTTPMKTSKSYTIT